MTRPKPPPLTPFHALAIGQQSDFLALLAERSRGATREGKPFFSCKFRDAQRTATAMVWGDSVLYESCEREWQAGQLYKIRGVYQEHKQYGPQIDIERLRLVTPEDLQDGFDPAAFVESTRCDRAAMYAELQQLVEEHIADEPLRRLVQTILTRQAEALQRVPATLKHFYPFHGGLLEHTLSVAQSALHLAQKYLAHYADAKPPLNVDLVVAGAVLHDIGRVLEFDADPLTPQPTVAGRMHGHLLLGRDLVRDTARELGDVSPELVQMLEHIVITHLAIPEWGSPRLPLIPECLIVHHADDLDAKMEMYQRCLRKDQESGAFTARDPVLNRQLYKGRTT